MPEGYTTVTLRRETKEVLDEIKPYDSMSYDELMVDIMERWDEPTLDGRGHTSLDDLGEEPHPPVDLEWFEYVIQTLREADELKSDLAWRDRVWENCTVEELIGALLEAEVWIKQRKND